jgi:hypothetical protein
MDVAEFERVHNLKFLITPVRFGWRYQESLAGARKFKRAFRRDGVHIGFAQGRNRVPRDQTICSKPPGSPIESRAARFVLAKLHELEQLFVSNETGVQDLAKQWVVVLDVQADAVFDVTHCQPAKGEVRVSCKRAIHDRAATGCKTNVPTSLRIQPLAGRSNMLSCSLPHSLNATRAL